MKDIAARELKGHNILAVERFWDSTCWMIEFTLPQLKSRHKGKKPQKPPRQTTPCSAWLTGKPSEPRARAWAMTAGRQSTT